jgi:hypothetical protein
MRGASFDAASLVFAMTTNFGRLEQAVGLEKASVKLLLDPSSYVRPYVATSPETILRLGVVIPTTTKRFIFHIYVSLSFNSKVCQPISN